MKAYYFDSSALVKLYVNEPGSQGVDKIVGGRGPDDELANLISIVQIGIVEIASAIARSQRTGRISPNQQAQIFYALQHSHQQVFHFLAITQELIEMASRLTQKYPLRGYDAIHLAAAILFQRKISQAAFATIDFVSADRQLCQAALAEGLHTINPNNLPEN